MNEVIRKGKIRNDYIRSSIGVKIVDKMREYKQMIRSCHEELDAVMKINVEGKNTTEYR